MKSRSIVLALASVVAISACGGTNKGAGSANSGGPAEGDDAATPFNDGAVKAAIASTPGVASCGVDPSTTMGAHLEAQRAMLKGDGQSGTVINEGFMCRAQGGGMWECEWSVATVGADDGTGFVIMVPVTDAGAISAEKISCNAPG